MTAEQSPPLTRREAGKAQRRRRIVEAAAALVRESDFDAVSMVQIAERAGLSPATLYNQFQTKAAIFREVFDRDLEDFEQRLARARTRDALDRIFVAIELAARQYRRDPEFYRAMARVGGHGANGLATAIRAQRVTFWQSLAADAVAQGCLRPDTDAERLGLTLQRFMRGIFLEWAAGSIPARRLAEDSAYAFALMLLPHASAAAAPALAARIGPRRRAAARRSAH